MCKVNAEAKIQRQIDIKVLSGMATIEIDGKATCIHAGSTISITYDAVFNYIGESEVKEITAYVKR